MLRYLPLLLVLALWIYAFVDCLNTPEDEVRSLPKVAWVFVILLFGEVLVGPVAWLLAGRPRRTAGAGGPAWVAPDDNPAFLESLRKKDDDPRGE
ncbi:PLD nuclease N-terminal domain-containing protein [Streptomyces sp. NPDC004065]|uniref:PLD nuclease N-terminal domain-containing protein n=1 Tax=Streptomyces sp. NPDC004065 TaxID=3364689 RepID=UPI00384A5BF7